MTMYTHQFHAAPRWKRAVLYVLGAFAFAPLVFMVPELATGNLHDLGLSTAAVLGVGGVIIFMAMLMISPLITITGWRWIAPLRWWYGAMFAATVSVDIVLTAIAGGVHLHGGFLSRTVGHPFTLVGVTATLLTVVILTTATHGAQRRLGRHWRTIQRWTYVVWALILLHVGLLMGLRPSENGILFFGDAQRFWQILFISIPLFLMRIPYVRDWWRGQRQCHGLGAWHLWAIGAVMLGVMVFFWGGLISYEIEQGTQAFTLTPRDE